MNKTNRIPTKYLNDLRTRIECSADPEELFNIAMDVKELLRFCSLCYGVVLRNDFINEHYFIRSDEPDDWKKNYIKNEYWKLDVRVIQARKSARPFYWRDLQGLSEYIAGNPANAEGLTVPIHGPKNLFGFLHCAYDIKLSKIDNWLAYVEPFLVFLAQSLIVREHKIRTESLYADPGLTAGQRKCLAWVADGKTSEQIGLILNISPSAVNKHLEGACIKLHADNRSQAIAKAIDARLIALSYKKKARIFYF